ncbi:MAG: hypothetical protein AB7T17_00050 [Geobacter sp.]
MKRLVLLLGLALLPLFSGCAHNYFNVPQDSFAEQVKVLGIVPIIVDGESDIRHPQREELIALLTRQSRLHERSLTRLIKNTNSFYTVTMLDTDPQALLKEQLFRRERRDDASIQYNKYFWKTDGIIELIHKSSLDALMVVVISGITRPERMVSANLMESLEADYNYLIMTAQILDRKGNILWEYPNFRTRSLSYDPLINLQYPNFDEARANLSSKVQIKFKALEGIKRALEKRRQDFLLQETSEVELYMDQFESMSELLSINREPKVSQAAEQPKQDPAKEPNQ